MGRVTIKTGEGKMRLKMLNSLIPACLGLVLTLGMASSVVCAQRSLAGTQWRLDSFGGVGDKKPVVDGTSITIQFGSDSRASGSSGCNSYSGTYNTEGERLSFGQMISTMRACVEPKANQQEQKYMAALRAITRFTITESSLSLSDDTEVLLNFISSQPSSNDQGTATTTPADMLNTYFAAINAKEYQKAYALWEHSTTTLEAFSRGYSDTQSVRVLIEQPLRIEGAAGSLFADVPTMVLARTKTGRDRVFAGCYVLRKSNIEEPPTGWHIHKASLAPVTQAGNISKLLFRQCNG
jgi:heat shock protein HslJ